MDELEKRIIKNEVVVSLITAILYTQHDPHFDFGHEECINDFREIENLVENIQHDSISICEAIAVIHYAIKDIEFNNYQYCIPYKFLKLSLKKLISIK